MTKLKNIAAAVASLVIFSSITNAQTATTTTTNYQVGYAEPFAVKYLGSDGDYLLFEVSMKSQNFGNAKIEIEDKKEGSLYASNIKNDFKPTTIKIEKRDDQVLNFKLVMGKKLYLKSFSVNTNHVENTTVSEADITTL